MPPFTDSFNGTPGTNLQTYNANWNFADFPADIKIATAGNAIQLASSGAASNYFCTDQGVDGSGRQYLRLKILDATANNARGWVLLQLTPTSRGFYLSLTTGSKLRILKQDDASVVVTGTTTVNANDVIGFSVSGTTPNFVLTGYINGTQEMQATGVSSATTATRQGLFTDVSQTSDPWITNFEAGSGPFPVASTTDRSTGRGLWRGIGRGVW